MEAAWHFTSNTSAYNADRTGRGAAATIDWSFTGIGADAGMLALWVPVRERESRKRMKWRRLGQRTRHLGLV